MPDFEPLVLSLLTDWDRPDSDDGLPSWLSGLSQSVSNERTNGSQSGMGGRYHVHSLAQLFCLPGSSAGCVLTALCGLEVVQAHRYRTGFRGARHGTGDTHD